jgi:hypothetical protein
VTAVAIALTVAAGLAGAVQAAVMGEIGERAGIFPALAFSGVVSVALGIALLLVAKQSVRGFADVVREPVWLWSGGALSVSANRRPRPPRGRRGADAEREWLTSSSSGPCSQPSSSRVRVRLRSC